MTRTAINAEKQHSIARVIARRMRHTAQILSNSDGILILPDHQLAYLRARQVAHNIGRGLYDVQDDGECVALVPIM